MSVVESLVASKNALFPLNFTFIVKVLYISIPKIFTYAWSWYFIIKGASTFKNLFSLFFGHFFVYREYSNWPVYKFKFEFFHT